MTNRLLARGRGSGRDDDGFILPLVLLVTMLLLVATGTMLSVVAGNAVPAQKTQARTVALAAAQSGVQAYLAELTANCSSYSIGECQWPFDASANAARTLIAGSLGAPTVTGADYTVVATNAQGFLNHASDDLRVLSTGCAPTCATTGATKVSLLADVSGTPNALRFGYFTNFESIDGNLLSALYPANRSIALSGPVAKLVGATGLVTQTVGGSVSWSGATTASSCNRVWSGATGRSAGTNDDPSETLVSAPTGVSGTFDHYCSVTFSKGMNFVGPVYSADQFLLSNGLPSSTTGPSFSVPIACTPSVTANCEPLPPASSAASTAFRSVAAPLGGAPATAGSVVSSAMNVTLPTNAADATATCVYTGANVSIVLSGGSATISNGTLTTGATAQCASPVTVTHKTIEVLGNISVQGSLSTGQVSLVALPNGTARGDIVVTGDLTASGAQATTPNQYAESGFTPGSSAGAIDLVATNDVVLQHNVSCAASLPLGTSPLLTATNQSGFCPNDISGLYTTSQSAEVVSGTGALKATHPARQYCNSDSGTNTYPCAGGTSSTCDSVTSQGREVDAAIFALNGSFRTDNFNRGCALGVVKVVGGIYQNHRGPLGQEWEISSGSSLASRPFSGYRLNLVYESLQSAGLPYVPALQGGSLSRPWVVVAVSSPTNASGS